MAYDINYDDKRFTQVESDKNAALSELEETYGGMIAESDKYYQAQIDASKEWADKQSQLQQEKTDFAIEKIEQEKDQTKKDYLKEQSGAYVDWQKESNQYGVNAERHAVQGMQNTGYSESAQVSLYNTYQNRVATARESYNQAVLNYNNAITEARLQNNSILAEIAADALKQQLELSLQGFQYKNTLVLEKANKKNQIDSEYYSRYQDVLKQINTENAMAEEVRQYNESMAMEKAQLAEEQRQYNASLAWEKQKYNDSKKSSGGGGGSSSKKSSSGSKKSSGSSGVAINKDDNSTPDDRRTMKSIIDLGYGPISEANLASKVAKGEVKQVEKDGYVQFEKNTSSVPKGKTTTHNYKTGSFGASFLLANGKQKVKKTYSGKF